MKRECNYCGKEYEAKTSSKYCDIECRQQDYRVEQIIKWQTDKNFRKKHMERHKTEVEKEKRRNHMKKTGYMKNYMKQWRKDNHEHWIQWRKENYKQNKEREIQRCREYRQTENGKLASKRHKAKRRKLGTTSIFGNKLIFPKETKPEFAHINPMIGAYLPKTTHNYIPGTKKEKHTKNTIKWIEKLYQIDLQKILK